MSDSPTHFSPLVKQGGNSLWHRLQRSWPFIRIGRAVVQRWGVSNVVAIYPNSTRDEFGIWITVNKNKQGTFDGRSATILIFSALLTGHRSYKETCFEIRLVSKEEKPGQSTVLRASAFGPSYVTEWPLNDAQIRTPNSLPATITSRPVRSGVLVFARSGRPGLGGVAKLVRFGVVVVHSGEVELMVLPSTSAAKWVTAFRRTRITPIPLDLAREAGSSFPTCAKQGDVACHPSCDDFGPDHMTPAVWKEQLAQGYVKDYDGDGPLTVSSSGDD